MILLVLIINFVALVKRGRQNTNKQVASSKLHHKDKKAAVHIDFPRGSIV